MIRNFYRCFIRARDAFCGAVDCQANRRPSQVEAQRVMNKKREQKGEGKIEEDAAIVSWL